MRYRLPLLALSIALLTAAPAFAQWQVSADAGMRYVRNTERAADGKRLVREDGWLPGIGVGADYKGSDWHAGLAGELYRKDIGYHGQLQTGAPFDSDTGTTQGRIRLEFGKQITQAVQWLAGIEYDVWKRDIHGTASVNGMQEKYTSWRLLTGAKGRAAQWDAGTLDLQGLLVLAAPERMTVRFDHQSYDDAHFSTEPALGVRLGATFQPTALPNLSLIAELDWLDVNRSSAAVLRRNGVAVGTITEPQHERAAFNLRASYRF
jgi:hypothetical protein